MAAGRVNTNLFSVGDFNGTIALYDLRQPEPTHKFALPSTPSALHLACDDSIVVSAANHYVYTWESSTGKPFLQNGLDAPNVSTHPGGYMHYKLITGLTVVRCFDAHQDPLLLSTGMDRLLRITSLNTFEVLHQERLVSPCTALGAFSDLSYVVVGTESGLVRTFSFTTPSQLLEQVGKKRNNTNADTDEPFAVVDPRLKAMVSRFSGKWRGINLEEGDKALTTEEWFKRPAAVGTRIAPKDWGFKGSRAPLIHEHTTISRVSRASSSAGRTREPVEIARLTSRLLGFQHSQALSEALRVGSRARAASKRSPNADAVAATAPLAVLAVVRELSRRGALPAAVGGQTEKGLARLLRFILRNTWRPWATPTCLNLFKVILKLYRASMLAENEEYAKVCCLIRNMSFNLQKISALSIKMRAVLYPEKVEAAPTPVPEDGERAAASPTIKSLKQGKTKSNSQLMKRQLSDKPEGNINKGGEVVDVEPKQVPPSKKSSKMGKLHLLNTVTMEEEKEEVESESTKPSKAMEKRCQLKEALEVDENANEVTTEQISPKKIPKGQKRRLSKAETEEATEESSSSKKSMTSAKRTRRK
ncbi:U3 small nucleolar RNA associated protein 15 [Echinococcus multilocularis]|uniref:U3 small nucleolar RNA associated protein 15 n=1 Tax=Echinococcus multilocularis TaxID=6211 RepID=A0A077RD01_ECHMU|nr:U3 small nucleolar RNA associated protein 15 [Echinococcus multilocularis]